MAWSDGALLGIAVVGLLVTIGTILAAAGFFRGHRVRDASAQEAQEVAAEARGRGGGGLAALRRRKERKRRAESPKRDQHEGEEEEGEARDQPEEQEQAQVPIEPRMMTKRELQKEQKRREREEFRQFREHQLEERRKREQAQDEAIQRQRAADAETEEAEEEAARQADEVRVLQEQQDFEKWKKLFSVEEQGAKLENESEESQSLLQEFVEYIETHKVVLLEDLGAAFGLSTQEAIQRVQTLQEEQRLTGIIDDRGKFICITEDEMDKVVKFIQRKGRVSLTDLAKECNRLIQLEGVSESNAPNGLDWLTDAETENEAATKITSVKASA